MDKMRREGVSVLEKINPQVDKPSNLKENKGIEDHTKQAVILSALAVIAIVGLLGLFMSGNLTGASIGTLAQGIAADATVTDTSSVTGSNDGSTNGEETTTTESTTSVSSGSGTTSGGSNNRAEDPISFELSSSIVPDLDTTTSLPKITLTSVSLGSSVRVNGDLLEANTEVTVELSDFVGQFSLNAHTVSLDGSISQIYLNGVSILTETEIDLEIDALAYGHLETDDITFSYLYLGPGTGDLEVEDRLRYSLDGDTLDLYDFVGSMSVTPSDNEPLTLIGTAESIESSSSILELDVE